LVSNRRLSIFVFALFLTLIAQATLMYTINPDYKSSGVIEGVGRGMEPDQFMRYAVRTENGNDLDMQVNVSEGYLIDVYLMTYENLMKLSSNQSFEYIPSASRMNVTSYSTSITLDGSVEVYDFVVVGHSSNPSGTYVHLSISQSHLPAGLHVVFGITQIVSMIVSTFLFFLIFFALVENSQEKNVYVRRKAKTRWTSIYMMSAYVTIGLFAIQIVGAMFLYWMVVGSH
jgi:hypothetical protein